MAGPKSSMRARTATGSPAAAPTRTATSVDSGSAFMACSRLVAQCAFYQSRGARLIGLVSTHQPSTAATTEEGAMRRGWARFVATPTAAAIAALLAAGPAWACAGLVTAGGNVRLLRTATLAAYHRGVEHYVTA